MSRDTSQSTIVIAISDTGRRLLSISAAHTAWQPSGLTAVNPYASRRNRRLLPADIGNDIADTAEILYFFPCKIDAKGFFRVKQKLDRI